MEQTPSPTPRSRRTRPASRSLSRGRTRQRTGAGPRSRARTPSPPTRRSSSSRSPVSVSNSTNISAGAQRSKSGGVRLEGVQKAVKVNKQFKKKVQAAMKSDNYKTGFMMEIFSNDILRPVECGQVVGRVGHMSNGIIQNFDPNYINHVASCLFNLKTMTQTPDIGDANLFTKNLVVDVIKQSVTYRFKNQTARTMTLKVFDVSPKNRNFQKGFDPVSYWFNAFGDENTAEPNKVNLNGITPNTLYAHPKMSETFKRQYSIDENIVVLEAGKEYVHKVIGPNITYDFRKYFDNPDNDVEIFQNQQKFVKMTFVTYHLDLATTAFVGQPLGGLVGQAQGGRFTDLDNSERPYGLLCEATVFTKIRMPDQVGFIKDTPQGNAQQLNLRKQKPYIIKDWTIRQFKTTTEVKLVQDENPSTQPPGGPTGDI